MMAGEAFYLPIWPWLTHGLPGTSLHPLTLTPRGWMEVQVGVGTLLWQASWGEFERV